MLPKRSRRQAERDRRRRSARLHTAARWRFVLERLESRHLLAITLGETTTFSLGGTTPNDGVGDSAGEYDQVVVAGQATLGGTIAVQLAAGYVPQAGDRFTIMTYQSVVGHYDAGRGFFGLAGDLWFEIEQTGSLTTAGAVTLVAHEVLPGFNSDLKVLEPDGVVAATIRDTIGTVLNRDYFGVDLQATFAGGFTYGELDIEGTVVLRSDQDPNGLGTVIEAAISGTAFIGTSLTLQGDFVASVALRDGASTNLDVCGQAVDLAVGIGGATFHATSGRVGLIASDAGVAVEAAASVVANLASDLSLEADEFVVSYNGTADDYSNKQVVAGVASYTFGTLNAGTFSVEVSGGELIAAGFLQAIGGFTIRGESHGITLSDGTTVTADVLTIGGTALDGFAGSGIGTASPTGVSISGIDIAVALVTETGERGRRWLTVNGSGQAASLAGIKSVSGSLTAVSLAMNIDAADGSVIDYSPGKTSLAVATGGGEPVPLSGDGSQGRTVWVSGTAAIAVNASLSLAGTVSIGLEGTNVVAVGKSISAQLGVADADTYLKVTGASCGLVAAAGETAFAVQGGLSASLAGLQRVTGESVIATYTSGNAEIKAGRKLGVGTNTYTFANGIGKGVDLFAIEGFEATVADFVTLSGDVGFRKDADALVAVGTNMAATMSAGGSSLTASGSFGLSVAAGKTAFELGGTFSGSVAGLSDVSAKTAVVRYTSTGRTVMKGESLVVGGASHTFTGDIAGGTASLTATGLSATVGSGFTITGDVGFGRDLAGLVATGTNIDARLVAGTSSVEVAGASLGLVATSVGTAVELSQGGFAATIDDLAAVKAASALARYTSADMEITAGLVIDVGGVSHTFTNGIAKNTFALVATGFEATVADFVTLSGDVGFKKDADALVAVGTNMAATMSAGGSSLTASGSFGLSVVAGKTAFELAGTFAGSVAGLSDISAKSAVVRYASTGRTVTKGESLVVGGASHTFTGDIAGGTASLTATGLSATVGSGFTFMGDLGFSRDSAGLVATGTNIDARLVAGTSSVEVTDASLGLVVTTAGTAVELSQGGFAATIQDLANITATSALARYTSTDMEIAAGRVIDVGGVSHTFSSGIGKNTLELVATGFEATVADFVTLSGNVGFKKDADALVAVGTNMAATMSAGGSSLTASGSFGLTVAAGQTAFELAGTFSGSVAGLSDVSAKTAVVRYTSTGRTVMKGESLVVGGASHTFTGDIAGGTASLTATGLSATVGSGFTITGDVGFGRDLAGLVATGTNIDARLVAGTSSVEVAGASLGLVATSVGTAVELSQGGFAATIDDLAGVKAASSLARYASADMEITAGRVIDVEGVSHTFTNGIAKNTLELVATGFEATVADFVTLSGNVGFKKDADVLVAVGTHMFATMSAGDSTLTASGSFGLSVVAGKTAFELGGTFAGAVAGLSDVSAKSALVRYASTGRTVTKGESLVVGGASYAFTGDIAGGTASLTATGLSATVGSGFTITGDVGFGRDLAGLVATGTNIDARLVAGTSSVEVAGASLGLVATSVGTAVELSQGGFAATIDDLAGVKAASSLARYASADMEITAGRVIDVGGVSHTFTDGIAKNTLELVATGFEATVADFVTLSGNVGFKKDADVLVAVGTNMTATMSAGVSSLTASGSFGLTVAAGKTAFELGGAFAGAVAGLSDVSAKSALVRYASTGRTVTKGESLVIGGTSYTFTGDIAGGTASLTATGLSATVGSGFTITGDLGFSRDSAGLVATGTNIDARLVAGTSSVEVTDASLGLVVTTAGTAVELSQGGFAATIQDLANITATSALARYTSTDMEIAAGRVIDVGGVSHTFSSGIGKNTLELVATGFEATVADFVTLSGNVGFKKDADVLVAVGTHMFATMSAGDSTLTASGSFGLSVVAGKTAFELGGTFAGAVAGLSDVSAKSALVRYASTGRTVTKGESLVVGGASHTFTGDIAGGTASLTATGLSATVGSGFTFTGDVGFGRDGTGLVATGTNIAARLVAGTSSVEVAGASLGLVATSVGTAVELSQGGFTATIEDLAGVKAASSLARYASADMEITAGRVIDVEGVSHTFTNGIAKNTLELVATGFEATVADFVTLSGNVGFKKDADVLVAVGTNMTATMSAGVSSLTASGSFGLTVAAGKTAFELGGAFWGSVAGLADVSGKSAVVRYASAGRTVTKGESLVVGGTSYTFTGDIAGGTASLTATGLSATVGSGFTFMGDLGFSRDSAGLVATGTNIDARLVAGTSSVEVTDASLGLVATSVGTAVELSQGGFTATIQDLANITATSALAKYTSTDMEIAAGRVIDVGGVSHTFSSGIGKNTLELVATGFEATVADFVTLSGDIGFKKVADALVAVGTNMTATLAVTQQETLSLTAGRLSLSVSGGHTAFEVRDFTVDSAALTVAGISLDVAASFEYRDDTFRLGVAGSLALAGDTVTLVNGELWWANGRFTRITGSIEGKLLTANAWIPVSISGLSVTLPASDASADIVVEVTGSIDRSRLQQSLRQLSGSEDLSIGIAVYIDSGWRAVADGEVFSFGVSSIGGRLWSTDVRPLRLDIQQLVVGLEGSTAGSGISANVSGSIAFGGLDSAGNLLSMDTSLASPYGGNAIAGSLSITGAGITGTVSLGGSWSPDTGRLRLDGVASLSGDVSVLGIGLSGTAVGSFRWDIGVDASGPIPDVRSLPVIDSIRAEDLQFVIPNVAQFDIGSIAYVNAPQPGMPFATATNVRVTALGVLRNLGLTGTLASLELYDDAGADRIIDGVSIVGLELTAAANTEWIHEEGGRQVLSAKDLVATWSNLIYRPAKPGFTTTGQIQLSASDVKVFPRKDGPFDVAAAAVEGSIDPGTGAVALSVGSFTMGFGASPRVDVTVESVSLSIDDDPATDLFAIENATVKLVDKGETLGRLSFEATGLRFNVVAGVPRLDVGGVTFTAGRGTSAAIGLAGFLPFDVTSAALAFGRADDGYSDLTNFTLDVGGFFDLASLEAALPFKPVVSVGGRPAGLVGSENAFEFGIAFDVTTGLFSPRSLSNIVVGFRDWKVGELDFAGQIGIAGYSDGVFDGSITGAVGIDRESPRNNVRPSGGDGVDFYGASITLRGGVSSTGGVTTLAVDADAASRFDLRLGDFLSISDLSFQFGFDITSQADFAADPLNRVALTPRLESLAVGSISAGIGDYLQFGATADAQGGAGLSINFDPEGDEPLATMNVVVSSPLIGVSGSIDGFRLLQGGVPDFDAIGRIDVSVVSRRDGSASLLQNLLSFLPLSVTQVGLKFASNFFETDAEGRRVGIADMKAFNLIVSGQIGTPSWLPENFPFKARSGFSGLELDVQKLLRGEFAIVDLAGLSFDVGFDLGAVKVGGTVTVGMVDADPSAEGVANVYYLTAGGDIAVSGYGFTGSIVLTTAGPVAATVAVPLAVPLGPTGFLISGVAGTLQFATATLPDPKDIKNSRDLGHVPNPIDRDLADPSAVEGVIQGLWDQTTGTLRATWDLPATLAIRGTLTHAAVAGFLSGSVTLAANVALPKGDVSAPQPGLAFLGFGSVDVYGYSFVDARVLFDLRDALNPSLGFLIQAPSSTNPLGVILPVKADFGVLVKTDGLAMATAIGVRSFVQKFAAGALGESQAFFDRVIDRLLTIVKTPPDRSAVAARLAAVLPAGTTLADLDKAAFEALLDDSLDLDGLLATLGTGKTIAELSPEQQAACDAKIGLARALLGDVLAFGADAVGPELTADQVVQSLERVLRSAVVEAIRDVDAFVRSDSFDPRIVIEGALQPSLFGVPVGDPVSNASASFSKKGVFVTLDALILPLLSSLSALPGFTAVGGASTLLLLTLANAGLIETTTLGLELPFDGIDTQRVLDGLADGTPPLAAFNPLGPDWGFVVNTRLNSITGLGGVGLSILQVAPGSPLVDRSLQLLPDLGAPFDPQRIPVSLQSIVDRLTADGGTLLTGTAFASRLITDPLSVIADVIAAKNAVGGVLDAGLSLETLASAFSSGVEFLQVVGDAISRQEELARLQTYLPITIGDLLPPGLVDLANDPGRFAEEYRAAFFNDDGSINATAVQDVLDRLSATLSARRDLATRGAIIDGVLNGKFLGVQLAEGRVTVDPSRPSAMVVEGRVPLLGNLQVKGVIDGGNVVLPPAPATGPDPYAGLRSTAGGDVLPIPRAMVEASFDTAATGEEGDFDRLIRSIGLDPGWFKLDVSSKASLRGYTPAYDLTSIDPVKRVGGFELTAGLDIPNFVDNASFQFQMSVPQPKDPANPATGTYIPFSSVARADWFGIRIDARDIAAKLFGGSRDAWYYAPLGLLSIDQGIRDVALSLHNDAKGTTFTAAGTFDVGAIIDVINAVPFVHVDAARQQRLSFTFDVTSFRLLEFGRAAASPSPLDVFLSSTSITEHGPPGTVVGEFGFFDAAVDAGALRYELVAGEGDADNALFRIVGDTLETVVPFDFNERPTRTIRVQVGDGKGQSVAKAITISVANVNDAPTAITLSSAGVTENAASGTSIGTLSSTDADVGDTFTYSLVAGDGGADIASFQIVGSELKTAAAIDFEAKSSLSVRVRTTDAGGAFTERPFTISVANVKEAPAIALPRTFSVTEDTPAPLTFVVPPFGTSDSPPTTMITVVLQVGRGTILAASAAGVVVGGTGQGRTFAGTITALNQYFTDPAGHVRYQPAANDNGPRVLAVTVTEAAMPGTLRSSASTTIEVAAVDDAPVVHVPAAFRVIEDVRGPISWGAVGVPFADVDSPNLTVTLSVPDGGIDAVSGGGVTVGGSPAARTFSGSTQSLNAFFKTLGRIGYTTKPDNTVARVLTTSVWDGATTATTTSRILITPVNDAPSIAPAATIAGATAGRPFVITYRMLVSASGTRDAEHAPLQFHIQSVQAGRLERWTGSRWIPQPSGGANVYGFLTKAIRPGDRIRWVPPVAARGTVRAFTVRVSDGVHASVTVSQVSVSMTG